MKNFEKEIHESQEICQIIMMAAFEGTREVCNHFVHTKLPNTLHTMKSQIQELIGNCDDPHQPVPLIG